MFLLCNNVALGSGLTNGYLSAYRVSFYAVLKSVCLCFGDISRKKSTVALQTMRIVKSFGICHDRKLSPFLPELKKLLDSVHVR